MYRITVKVKFDEEWVWDGVEFAYPSEKMAIDKSELIEKLNNNLKASDAVFHVPECGCVVDAVCKDDNGAYLDSETLYGNYNSTKGFIED